jgi:hypothetical protein
MLTTAPEVRIFVTPVASKMAVTDLLFSGILQRFPQLQMDISECGTV